MEHWFKYNNINSTDMGVILTTTPPIVRAGKRYNEIYVNGKDGCEIDELGYSSYIKKISIGIKKDANLNAILNWLTGDGQLLFWNESDKYYDAKILEQIDYARLLSFHTADIVFLCQPYKYSMTETTFSLSDTSIIINNDSNCVQLPIVKVTGAGEITLTVNDKETCSLTLSYEVPNLQIDSTTQDAYYNGALANRSMRGNFIKLAKGSNVITYSGNVDEIEVRYRKRWL